MASQVEALEAEAMKLTAEERARLADRLLASLSDDAEIEAGRAPLIPAAEAIARTRDALK
jgi:hypothetical protein